MADNGPRCTRRKQANPRRKTNVDPENVASNEVEEPKEPITGKLDANPVEEGKGSEAKASEDELTVYGSSEPMPELPEDRAPLASHSPAMSPTEPEADQCPEVSTNSEPQPRPQEIVCNRPESPRNSFSKSLMTDVSSNGSNGSKDIDNNTQKVLNGNESDASLQSKTSLAAAQDEEGNDGESEGEQVSLPLLLKRKATMEAETLSQRVDLEDPEDPDDPEEVDEEDEEEEEEEEEDEKIKEYLKRSDTAVIFPEPVDPVNNEKKATKELLKNHPVTRLELVADKVAENGSQTKSNTSGAASMPSDLLARCPHCGKLFRGPRASLSLQEHITNIHAAVAPLPPQPASPSSVSNTSSNSHTTSEKPFLCIKCKAAFTQKEHLEKHQLLHSTSSGQFCQLCAKSFANVYRLQRHMLSHDESQVLRKFKCPECGKAFKFKHHLKEHIRIHSGEKPFACPNCQKRFSHSGSYSSHMTSKKCLVVNLKVRKVDQMRSQKSRAASLATENDPLQGIGASNRMDSGNGVNEQVFSYGFSKSFGRAKESPFLEDGANFQGLPSDGNHVYLSHEFQQCLRNPQTAPFLPHSSYAAGMPLHPALLSAAAAAANSSLPHYMPTALSSFPDVAQALLKSRMPPEGFCDRIPREKGAELVSNESMKRILEMVDPSKGKHNEEETSSKSSFSRNGFPTAMSSNSSPISFSVTSLPSLPQMAPIDSSPEDTKCSNNYSLKCKYCSKCFDSKSDLVNHEKYSCKLASEWTPSKKPALIVEVPPNIRDSIMRSNTPSNKVVIFGPNESDDDSQRDSSLDEDMTATDGKKVRVRSVLSEDTLRVLRAQYEVNPRPKKHDILRLSQEVNYPPRVVQVWFQNMRARDRRLGRPIPNGQSNPGGDSGGDSQYPQGTQGALSPAPVSVAVIAAPASSQQLSGSQSPLPISIPHYRPHFNNNTGLLLPPPALPVTAIFTNGSLPEIASSPRHVRSPHSLETPSPAIAPTSLVSGEPRLMNGETAAGLPDIEQPLDLSVRSKSESLEEEQVATNGPADQEEEAADGALNLSQKSSRQTAAAESSLLAASPRNENMRQPSLGSVQRENDHSVIRSMLVNRSGTSHYELPVNAFTEFNFNGPSAPCSEHLPSDRRSPPDFPEKGKSGRKRSSSENESEDGAHQSDSTSNLDYFSDSNHDSSKGNLLSSPSPAKLWKPAAGDLEPVGARMGSLPGSGNEVSPQADPTGLFSCDQCDKTFSKQSSLARHKYEHSGQRPHKCDVCNKAFKHKHHLTEHKRLHSGEKPFQCKKCLKRFSHSGSYSQHMNHRYSYCKPYRE